MTNDPPEGSQQLSVAALCRLAVPGISFSSEPPVNTSEPLTKQIHQKTHGPFTQKTCARLRLFIWFQEEADRRLFIVATC